MTGPLRFDGRSAIITGAGRGLGRAYAEFLATRGARVLVNDIYEDSAQEAVDAIRAAGGTAVANGDSVAEQAGAQSLVDTALRAFGAVDIFIHNAGAAVGDLEQHMAINVWGGTWIAQALWDQMRERRYGRILYTTSGIGIYGNTVDSEFGADALYGVAKMGLLGLARHLAVRGVDVGINVNAISPLASTNSLRQSADIYSLTPRIRWVRDHCTVDVVAPVAGWLVHEDCAVTGEVYRAAGGRVARIFFGETRGYVNDRLTIEDVRDNMGQIRSEAGYVVPRNADESPEIYVVAGESGAASTGGAATGSTPA